MNTVAPSLKSEVFETFLGAFQGDGLSRKLFTLILAAALHHLRDISDRLSWANSWAAKGKMLNKLDITHRKHLDIIRKILNIRWPTSVMSHNTLYERCQARPLSEREDEIFTISPCKFTRFKSSVLYSSLAQ